MDSKKKEGGRMKNHTRESLQTLRGAKGLRSLKSVHKKQQFVVWHLAVVRIKTKTKTKTKTKSTLKIKIIKIKYYTAYHNSKVRCHHTILFVITCHHFMHLAKWDSDTINK
jgi:hypothetical protein